MLLGEQFSSETTQIRSLGEKNGYQKQPSRYNNKMNRTNQSDPKYREVYHNVLEILKKDDIKSRRSIYEHLVTDRLRWSFINETHGSIKISPSKNSLKNCFGELTTDEYEVAKILSQNFFSLGSFCGPWRPYSNNLSAFNYPPQFSFEPIPKKTPVKKIKALIVNKPL